MAHSTAHENTGTSEWKSASPVSKRRAFLFRLLAVAVGIFAALLILEVSARIFLYRYGVFIDDLRNNVARAGGGPLTLRDLIRMSSNERRCYELIPGARGTFVDAPVEINSAGFRDKERALTKPPQTWRIAILGDSIAFGWGVKQDERFGDVLENLVNSQLSGTTSTRVECLNFAVPGYNSVMEEATLRDVVLGYQPDLVIVHLVTNDDEIPNFIRIKPHVWSLQKCFIVEMMKDRLVGRPVGDTARLLIGGVVEAGGRGHGQHVVGYRPELVPPEYRFLVGRENMRRALHTMRDICKERGIKTLLVPHYEVTDLVVALEQPSSTSLVMREWLDEAEKAEFDNVVNPLPHIVKYALEHKISQDALSLSRKDHHPTPLAHRLIAESLVERVLQLLRTKH